MNDRTKRLHGITNGIITAGKIHNIYKSNLHSDSRTVIKAGRLSMINDILQALSEHSPDKPAKLLSETIDKTVTFSNTYKGLKRHLSLSQERSMTGNDMLETLSIMKPALNNQQKVLIDKIIKIYDILINK
jgi:hypothetical protein